MVGFITDHREQYGVEPICAVLPIAPSTYQRRLMRAMGLAGTVCGRARVTTTHASDSGWPADLVDRQFVATRPNPLWPTMGRTNTPITNATTP